MDLNIEGNVAVITASSSGLGFESAKSLVQEGAHVVINGRNEERLQEATRDLRDVATEDVRVVPVQGDIADKSTTDEIVKITLEEFGRLDHLVTSAGGPPSGPFLETDDEKWHQSFDMLVMSVVRLCRRFAEPLADGGGTIVNITSRAVKEASDGVVLSNSVRMCVIGLGKTLSKELAPEVRCNAVLPGPHDTDRIHNLVRDRVELGQYESYEEGLEAVRTDNPLNQLGDPSKLGSAVTFLCSPESGHINGTTLLVEGGSVGRTFKYIPTYIGKVHGMNEPSSVVESLIDDNVFSTADINLSITKDFRQDWETYVNRLRSGSRETELENRLQNVGISLSESASEDGIEKVGFYLALEDYTELPSNQIQELTYAYYYSRGESPPSEGVPEAFVPIHGDRLTGPFSLPQQSILYIWKTDCDPCDDVRSELDAIFADSPDDVALFGIHGPDWKKLLREEFSVVGSPTLLFMLNRRVDSRLEGAHYRSVIEHEIAQIRSS